MNKRPQEEGESLSRRPKVRREGQQRSSSVPSPPRHSLFPGIPPPPPPVSTASSSAGVGGVRAPTPLNPVSGFSSSNSVFTNTSYKGVGNEGGRRPSATFVPDRGSVSGAATGVVSSVAADFSSASAAVATVSTVASLGLPGSALQGNRPPAPSVVSAPPVMGFGQPASQSFPPVSRQDGSGGGRGPMHAPMYGIRPTAASHALPLDYYAQNASLAYADGYYYNAPAFYMYDCYGRPIYDSASFPYRAPAAPQPPSQLQPPGMSQPTPVTTDSGAQARVDADTGPRLSAPSSPSPMVSGARQRDSADDDLSDSDVTPSRDPRPADAMEALATFFPPAVASVSKRPKARSEISRALSRPAADAGLALQESRLLAETMADLAHKFAGTSKESAGDEDDEQPPLSAEGEAPCLPNALALGKLLSLEKMNLLSGSKWNFQFPSLPSKEVQVTAEDLRVLSHDKNEKKQASPPTDLRVTDKQLQSLEEANRRALMAASVLDSMLAGIVSAMRDPEDNDAEQGAEFNLRSEMDPDALQALIWASDTAMSDLFAQVGNAYGNTILLRRELVLTAPKCGLPPAEKRSLRARPIDGAALFGKAASATVSAIAQRVRDDAAFNQSTNQQQGGGNSQSRFRARGSRGGNKGKRSQRVSQSQPRGQQQQKQKGNKQSARGGNRQGGNPQ